MFVVRDVVRRPVAQLGVPRNRQAAFAAFVALLGCSAGFAPLEARATSATTQQPTTLSPHLPASAVHTEFVVEVNGKGQVTRVKSVKSCPDLAFNAMTYGNALQAFIRTSDGRAIAGKYRLLYDYDPRAKSVHRSVEFIQSGGVDPNRIGAVDQMAAVAKRNHGPSPAPTPTGTALPDFKAITGHRH